jgi:hypothetical protein
VRYRTLQRITIIGGWIWLGALLLHVRGPLVASARR